MTELLKLLCIFLLLRFIWCNWIRPLFLSDTDRRRERQQRAYDQHRKARQRYLTAFMPLIARIAKSDGCVSKAEIDSVERLFQKLGLDADERSLAIAIFTRTKDDPAAFEEALAQFSLLGYSFEMRYETFLTLYNLARIDQRVLVGQTRDLLLRVASAFGIPRPLIVMLMGQTTSGAYRGNGHAGYGNAYQRQQPPPPHPATPTREEDLALFGLGPNATASDIKKAYRKKVKELHPDRLQAQGLPQSMIQEATQRMTIINAAYDRLSSG